VIVLVVALLVLALVPAGASAAEPVGWNGENPFVCTVQQAGFGAEVPDPGADPYCVEFDKRRQNVTELGIVDFLSKEPARVAAAGDKCFYFQSDHWRSSVVQDDGSTKLYEWDGHYFFDKARGEGGAWVANFNVNGRSEDPSRIPGIPPEYAQHMGMGTGGVRVVDGSVPIDPRCAERAAREPEKIYAADARRAAGQEPGSAAWATSSSGCRRPARGRVTSRALGPVAIGDPEQRVRSVLGAPDEIRRGFLRYCAGGGFLVGQRSDRSGDLGSDDEERTVMLVATRGRFRAGRYGPGTRAPKRWRTVARVGGTRVLARSSRSPILLGVRRGRVRFVAVADRRAIRTRRGLEAYLRRALAGD
jgi:hypothetical protein